MGKKIFNSNKGVSTAIGSAFFIIIVVVSLGTFWAISDFESRYQDVRQDMNEWDIERFSENMKVKNVESPSTSINYTYDIIVDNIGGVYTNIVRVYIYDQTNGTLQIFDRQEGNGSGFINPIINVGELDHQVSVKGDSIDNGNKYRIILATDRGRQFSITYPEESSSGGGYALIMADDNDNFQYIAGSNTTFKSAFVKPKGTDNTLYRVRLNNTTERKIIFHENTTFLQMVGAPGSVDPRFIVDNSSSIPDNLVAFSSQSIDSGESEYLYFAADAPGGTNFEDESSNKAYYLVAVLVYFYYDGDPELRNISTPAIAQELT